MKRQHMRGLVTPFTLVLIVVLFELTSLAASAPEAAAFDWLVASFTANRSATLGACSADYAEQLEPLVDSYLDGVRRSSQESLGSVMTRDVAVQLITMVYAFRVYPISNDIALVSCSYTNREKSDPATNHIVVREDGEWKVGLALTPKGDPIRGPVQPVDSDLLRDASSGTSNLHASQRPVEPAADMSSAGDNQIRQWKLKLAQAGLDPSLLFAVYSEVITEIGDAEFTFNYEIYNKRSARVFRLKCAAQTYKSTYGRSDVTWAANFFKGTYQVYQEMVMNDAERVVWLDALLRYVADWLEGASFYDSFFGLVQDEFAAAVTEYLSLLRQFGPHRVPTVTFYYVDGVTAEGHPDTDILPTLYHLASVCATSLPESARTQILQYVTQYYPDRDYSVMIEACLVEDSTEQGSQVSAPGF